MSTSQTPTPWSDPCPYSGNRYEIMGTQDGTERGKMGTPSIAIFRKLEDARLCQRAVNNHQHLLSMCEAALKWLEAIRWEADIPNAHELLMNTQPPGIGLNIMRRVIEQAKQASQEVTS